MSNLKVPKLHLVTDRNLCGEKSLLDVVDLAIQGGVDCIQLREKNLNTRDFLQLSISLKNLLSTKKIPFIINDRLDIALACDADGLHLGQDDLPCHIAREILGENKIIGLSISTLQEFFFSKKSPADYFGVGSIFTTTTKQDAKSALGLKNLFEIKKQSDKPIIAIGGIHEKNISDVIKHGADGIAVVSAICGAEDPRKVSNILKGFIIK